MKQRLVTVEFLLNEREEGDDDGLNTRADIAQVLQDWFDRDGGFGGNFHVASMVEIDERAASAWFRKMND